MAITKVTNRVLENSSVGVAQLSAGAVPTKLGSEIGAFNFRNKIINGNFDIWQRGTTSSGPLNFYLADRWQSVGFATTITASRQTFTLNQLPDAEAGYFIRHQVTTQALQSGSGNPNFNYYLMQQIIENVRTFAGKTVTVSFWAKADSNKPIVVELLQFLGSNSQVGLQKQQFNLTTSWQKYTFTATMPSLAGQTILNENNGLILNFWMSAASYWYSRIGSFVYQSGTFDIAQVQLEEGSVATPFEQRPIGTELALCQRYYEKSYPVDIAPGAVNDYRGSTYELQAVYTTNAFAGALLKATFKQTKRTSAPAITVYNPNNGTANQLVIWSNGIGTVKTDVAISTPVADHSRAFIWPIAGTTVNSGYICIAHWAVDAEL